MGEAMPRPHADVLGLCTTQRLIRRLFERPEYPLCMFESKGEEVMTRKRAGGSLKPPDSREIRCGYTKIQIEARIRLNAFAGRAAGTMNHNIPMATKSPVSDRNSTEPVTCI